MLAFVPFRASLGEKTKFCWSEMKKLKIKTDNRTIVLATLYDLLFCSFVINNKQEDL